MSVWLQHIKRAGTTAALAVATAVLAIVFWSAGLWTVPHPLVLATLLGSVLLLAVAATVSALTTRHRSPGRRRSTAALAAAALLCLSAALVSDFLITVLRPSIEVLRFGDQAVTPGKTTLRILDFNVLHGYPLFHRQEERYGRTLKALRGLDIDILLLQEAWITRHSGHFVERLSRDLGLQAAWAKANGSLRFLGFEEGAAILSRYPISEPRAILLPASAIWEKRIGLSASIELTDGSRLRVVTTHLANADPRGALEQARFLSRELAALDPHILGGDLNAAHDAAPTLALASGRLRAAVSSGIDHILVSSELPAGWSVAGTEVVLQPELSPTAGMERRHSDHPALLVQVERQENPPAADEISSL